MATPVPSATAILCIGGATLDRKLRLLATHVPETSNPVRSSRAFGGVARNVAENLARLGVATALASIVGADEAGRALLTALSALGVDTRSVVDGETEATAEYIAVLSPDGDLVTGLADMKILDALTPDRVLGAVASHRAHFVFADCNLPAESLSALVALARDGAVRLAIDAVSALKVRRLPQDLAGLDILFLNRDEASALLDPAPSGDDARLAALVARGARRVVLTCGAEGLMVADEHGIDRIPAVPASTVDATGAGDALIAATLADLHAGADLKSAAARGALAAALTLESAASVRPDLSSRLLAEEARRRTGRAIESR